MKKIKRNLISKSPNRVSVRNIKNHILIVVCGILMVASVFITVESSTSGSEVANLNKVEIQLINQKRSLEESLVKGVSMSGLVEKSAELGFVKPENLVYVSGVQDTTVVAPVANLH